MTSTDAPTPKVIDLSLDVDQAPDSNGSYTSATLEKEDLPPSFTICTAYMVEAWNTGFSAATIFTLKDDDGDRWGYVSLYAASDYTEYEVYLGPTYFLVTTPTVYFPLQWTRVCVSLDLLHGEAGGGRPDAGPAGVQGGGI